MSTFKAQLIEDEGFYTVKRLLTILSAVSAGLIGFFSSSFTHKGFFIIPVIIVVFAAIFYYQSKFQKEMRQKVGKRKIEIDSKEIIVMGKGKQPIQRLPIEEGDHIIVKEEYKIPEETIRSSLNEMGGDPTKNFLIIKKGGKEMRFDFLLDSHYMITQLHKVIQSWKDKGYQLTVVD